MKYNWQYKNWPNFQYNLENFQGLAVSFAKELGLITGIIKGLDDHEKNQALLEVLISEAMQTSAIEGEYMNREDVRSSIMRNLGFKEFKAIRDKRVSGISKLMTIIQREYTEELSIEMIQEWHALLMESFPRVKGGIWRNSQEPMVIISGPHGREIIHFEAPPSVQVPAEMNRFVQWFNTVKLPASDEYSEALIKSSITHLYFESIHPFEDGNGRIGRALAEFALSQSLNMPVMLSISNIIEQDRRLYYEQLKAAQSGLEISKWILYFSQLILDAIIESKEIVEFTLHKTQFLDSIRPAINNRQEKVIYRMLKDGKSGFEGGISANKYMAISKISKATATRDLQHLVNIGAFKQVGGGGRSVRYDFVWK